ncbi:hypothetical protein [Pontibacter oryzae]|uniref:Uncharacterized protein n=1 Tax=Pontibacter oryzae TaxID=2304593 RepID=A0A399SIF2_9BACT|nr:hypothetical protein [Pontibacter oryzae]RIJ41505.1 hypothetical protein D1627_05560 [Pontibacter oryzae]
MINKIKNRRNILWLVLPLAISACQESARQENDIASTHPELSEKLSRDSLTLPYTDTTNRKLYDRYRITTEQYMHSGDYGVGTMYRGKLAPLDESSHSDAPTHRSMLQKGMKEGVNFAGKYTVVSISCGTNCQQHYVIDRETGKVLDKIESRMGATFNTKSRLLIINPPDSTRNYAQ